MVYFSIDLNIGAYPTISDLPKANGYLKMPKHFDNKLLFIQNGKKESTAYTVPMIVTAYMWSVVVSTSAHQSPFNIYIVGFTTS
jgi:hypothetical protein